MNGHDTQVSGIALHRRVPDVSVADKSVVVLKARQIAVLTGFWRLPASIGHARIGVDLRARLTALVVEAITARKFVWTVFWACDERFIFFALSIFRIKIYDFNIKKKLSNYVKFLKFFFRLLEDSNSNILFFTKIP